MNELAADISTRLFCSFRTQGRLYGIDATQVREVSTQVDCTAVPQAPPAIRGLTNLRSRIYLVVDVRPLLGLEPAECTAESRLIVVKPDVAEDLGILVEHGGDIIHVDVNQIEGAPAATAATGDDASGERALDVTAGVCKLESELMTIIDAARIVEALSGLMK